jgi:flagellar basal-body rod modification protein FlgD
MSAVSSLGTSSSGNLTSSETNSLSTISQQDFLQLLLTELQNQNPLDPMSDTDFATQLATLSEVGSLDAMQTTSSDLLQVQQLSSAASLFGQTVTYTPSGAASSSTGTVNGLTVQSDGTVDLSINGSNVPLSQVNSIS